MPSGTPDTSSTLLPVCRQDIDDAHGRLRSVIRRTPLELSERLSAEFQASIYLKREDLQTVRSYKIRGAYNRMSQLAPAVRSRGIVCASAGNHAQGVALSCRLLQTRGVIFMPQNTPRQKVARVRTLGGEWVRLEMVGDTFDAAKRLALLFASEQERTLVHPFDDPHGIAGQGTVAREILEQLPAPADHFLVPVGGGGLLAGMAVYTEAVSPGTRLTGVEPDGAASLRASLDAGRVVALSSVDTFVDGAAVQEVGHNPFAICAALKPGVIAVSTGHVCTSMIHLYQNDGIITEPAGALTVAALDSMRGEIAGKNVVCVVSGGNNDLSRYPEIIERSLIHQGLKHYFLIAFSQRAGALRQYLDEALGENDDVTLFEYVKKNNREFGPALVGIELTDRADLAPLLARMDAIGLRYQAVEQDSLLYRFLV
ncbi:MAG: threonine ammonia-lyase IlvA [Cytophagales bacterium]|nr:threonine ammonia-lyase IlvA [Armatimonadota bacterium]